jgi:hypothetical protein
MKIIVSGPSKLRDAAWVSSVLSEYCRKNKVTSIVVGQEEGVEHDTVVWCMEKKMKMFIVPTPKVIDGNRLFTRNLDLLKKHTDAKVLLHFKGDALSEHLCAHAIRAKMPVDDVYRRDAEARAVG